MLAWLAQQIQDPAEKTQVAIVLQGKQGVGKDIVFEFYLTKVLGFDGKNVKNCVGFQTADPTEHIFGKHAEAPANKVFVLIDEIKSDAMRPLMDKIKNFITCDHININPKGQTMYSVSNLSNVLCTTNHINPIELEPGERRFVVFQCKKVEKYDTAYFQQLLKHLERDKVARAFYQYLKDRVDVSPFLPFQAHRPKTDAYIAMQQRNIPLVYKFLSYRIQHAIRVAHESKSCVRAKPFYDDFVQWAHERGHSTSKTTLSKFGGDLRDLIDQLGNEEVSLQGALEKHTKSHGYEYCVKWQKLREYMQKSALYDPNAGD